MKMVIYGLSKNGNKMQKFNEFGTIEETELTEDVVAIVGWNARNRHRARRTMSQSNPGIDATKRTKPCQRQAVTQKSSSACSFTHRRSQ